MQLEKKYPFESERLSERLKKKAETDNADAKKYITVGSEWIVRQR